MNEKRAIIFVNGELPDLEAAAGLICEDDFLVAADGGLRHLQAMGLTPHLLIGDLDSASPEDVAEMQTHGVRIQQFPPAKDETDIELALQSVLDNGYEHIILMAALGGRMDHALGILHLLTNPAFRDANVRLDDGRIEAFVIWQSGILQGQVGDMISLLPVEAAVKGVTTDGLEYPLRSETLWRHQGLGISNVMVSETAKITVEDGAVFCFHSRQ
jgi:thiamine pyrophosphokinase